MLITNEVPSGILLTYKPLYCPLVAAVLQYSTLFPFTVKYSQIFVGRSIAKICVASSNETTILISSPSFTFGTSIVASKLAGSSFLVSLSKIDSPLTVTSLIWKFSFASAVIEILSPHGTDIPFWSCALLYQTFIEPFESAML